MAFHTQQILFSQELGGGNVPAEGELVDLPQDAADLVGGHGVDDRRLETPHPTVDGASGSVATVPD